MSKKHYEYIARVIREVKQKNANESTQNAVDEVARELAIFFKLDNNQFKGLTFLNACGIK
jgi:hypothetical protein